MLVFGGSRGNLSGMQAAATTPASSATDPLSEYLDPPDQGMRLGDRGYERIVGELVSARLGLTLQRLAGEPRLAERVTGRVLPTPIEDHLRAQRADAETQRADTETRRADAAEREVARLRAQLARK